jgi:hypothetical protein
MPELSPAAQKILRADAAERCLVEWSSVNDPPCHPSDEGWKGCGTCVNRAAVAAALQAAVDQVVPELSGGDCSYDCCITQCEEIRAELLAIAAELKAQ